MNMNIFIRIGFELCKKDNQDWFMNSYKRKGRRTGSSLFHWSTASNKEYFKTLYLWNTSRYSSSQLCIHDRDLIRRTFGKYLESQSSPKMCPESCSKMSKNYSQYQKLIKKAPQNILILVSVWFWYLKSQGLSYWKKDRKTIIKEGER